ncbi:hypothetical protein BGZ65_005257 [Modicella reniformis]|uniref:Chitin-binding type-4 domain-containing protein n=1 Tax=Modicella reniformis TaxID=1440133 RepID=A0A9P6MB90_9FUNG|nr:hypothetical protein BGZ65_005257 [Modicella reniformis]
MKFTTVVALTASYVAVASAHMAMLRPIPRGGYETPQYNGRVHAFLGFKDKKYTVRFPCGGYAPGPVTQMKAGDVIDVRFQSTDMSDSDIKKQPTKPKDPKKQFDQPRHGGGTCEFSLSYDNGQTFHLIGRYTKSCPDAYFKWPVKIPADVPECTSKNKCLFVWTWLASTLDQFYMNCADINLTAPKGGKKRLPQGKVTFVDFGNYKKNQKAPGDGTVGKGVSGPGPNSSEVKKNKSGGFSTY